jgi:hypothetical protein
MKKLITLAILCIAYTANAQYYSVNTSINPVTSCNSSSITSVNIDIDCEGPCKALIGIYDSSNSRWKHLTTKTSDNSGNIRHIGTGLKLNKTFKYRIYVFPTNKDVRKYEVSDSEYRTVDLYTKKICR